MESDDLLHATGGDRARARLLRQVLTRLSQGTGGERLREMADDVLAGRLSLSDAMASPYYGEAVQEQTTEFLEWHQRLSDEERAEHVRRGEAEIERLRDEIDAESAQVRKR
jgi:hypothetical protein